MIELKNVFLKYTKEFYSLYDINLKIDKGETIALLGKENSGKSSILRLIAKLEKATKGSIYIFDRPLNKFNFANDFSLGYIPYKGNFLENKTVYDNLKYILKVRKVPKQDYENIINQILIDFNLEGVRDDKLSKMSLYNRYVLSIARLSLRKLDAVLIDNIFEELDDNEQKKIIALIKKYFINKKITSVIATSNENIAKSVAKRIVKLENGSIITDEEK